MIARRTLLSGLGWLLYVGSLGAATAVGQQLTQSASAPDPSQGVATVKVIMRTTLGDIALVLEQQRAPVTVNNFLRYVDHRRLDGVGFYRAMKLDDAGQRGLIQGGLRGDPKRVFKPIAHESTRVTGLSHVNGAISMARHEPGTAAADFFIVIGDVVQFDAQPDDSDPGYAVFGHVVEGMDVVHAILEKPRAIETGEGVMKGQMIASPVKIFTVRRVE